MNKVFVAFGGYKSIGAEMSSVRIFYTKEDARSYTHWRRNDFCFTQISVFDSEEEAREFVDNRCTFKKEQMECV